jgi:hypothetical protein
LPPHSRDAAQSERGVIKTRIEKRERGVVSVAGTSAIEMGEKVAGIILKSYG